LIELTNLIEKLDKFQVQTSDKTTLRKSDNLIDNYILSEFRLLLANIQNARKKMNMYVSYMGIGGVRGGFIPTSVLISL